ncbi:MAG: pyruvate kinase [Thermodesulfobacteriota bacterium]
MKTRKTKIVCTIGPASASRKMLKKLILAGMNVARLNFSHGSHEEHRKVVLAIRSLSESLGKPVAILQDLQGPKIRTGKFEGGSVVLQAREKWVVTPRRRVGKRGIIPVSYPRIADELGKGARILLADGEMELEVLSRKGSDLLCRVITGGTLGERKGVNLPGVKTVLPSLTKKDKEDLEFGIEVGVDYMALSFVRSGRDVRALKRALKSKGANIPVISKIEKPQALEDLEAILEESDGVMVARGDLGVELSPEKVPMAQKRIIRMANEKYKWVITATQMLESMTDHARPTRAETSDVANAILDGTDAVMLSGETSVGRYPVGSVKMMDRIARETEKEFPAGVHTAPSRHRPAKGFPDAISLAACTASDSLGLKAICAFTKSGFTAGLVSKHRPTVPIIAFTHDPAVQRRVCLYWGVSARILPLKKHAEAMIEAMEAQLLRERLVGKGDQVAVVAGIPLMIGGIANLLKLHAIGEA